MLNAYLIHPVMPAGEIILRQFVFLTVIYKYYPDIIKVYPPLLTQHGEKLFTGLPWFFVMCHNNIQFTCHVPSSFVPLYLLIT